MKINIETKSSETTTEATVIPESIENQFIPGESEDVNVTEKAIKEMKKIMGWGG